MALSRDDAKGFIDPYKNILNEIIELGCSDFFSLLKYSPHPIQTRAIYTLIYEFIEARAKEKLDGVNGVVLLNQNGLFLAVLQNKVILRFKKINGKKMPSNIPTHQTIAYMNQQLDLPDFSFITTLIVGYELNRFKTKLQEVTITCPNGKKNFWTFNLDGKGGAEILELPISPTQTPDIPIRPKKGKETRRKGKNGYE